MSRIILITGKYDTYINGIKGEKEFVVSHGINEDTGISIVLPNEHPMKLGGKFDIELGEWVIND